MRHAFWVVISALPLAQAFGQDHSHEHHDAAAHAAASDAPIKITINPEARISVTRGGDLPLPAKCGDAVRLPVSILNQGFLTASLEARLVDSIPEGVRIAFSAERLKGTEQESRVLLVTLQRPGLVDITVAFNARNDVADLGGRDRLHVLLRCTDPGAP